MKTSKKNENFPVLTCKLASPIQRQTERALEREILGRKDGDKWFILVDKTKTIA